MIPSEPPERQPYPPASPSPQPGQALLQDVLLQIISKVFSPRALLLAGIGSVLTVLAVAVLMLVTFRVFRSQASGQVSLSDGQATRVVAPWTDCASGETDTPTFNGVELYTKSMIRARLQEADGQKTISLWGLGQGPILLQEQSCSNFFFHQRFGNVTFDKTKAKEGTGAAECDIPGLGHIIFQADFKNCH